MAIEWYLRSHEAIGHAIDYSACVRGTGDRKGRFREEISAYLSALPERRAVAAIVWGSLEGNAKAQGDRWWRWVGRVCRNRMSTLKDARRGLAKLSVEVRRVQGEYAKMKAEKQFQEQGEGGMAWITTNERAIEIFGTNRKTWFGWRRAGLNEYLKGYGCMIPSTGRLHCTEENLRKAFRAWRNGLEMTPGGIGVR